MLFDTLPPFPGLRPEAFQFLRDLRANNNRDWFKPRKAVLDDELIDPIKCLVAQVGREAHGRGLPLTGDPSKSLFRIYRDVRFSKNKDPYKTHIGATLTRSGKRDDPGGLYLHVQPEGSFLAAGFWAPPKDLLSAWRERMAADPDGFLRVAETLETNDLDLSTRESLKRMPRGYESLADHPAADYLKWKGHIATRPVDDDALMTPDFAHDMLDFAEATRPLLDYGWRLADA